MDKNQEEKIIRLIFTLGRFVREHSGVDKPDSPSFIQLEMMKEIHDKDGLTMKDMAEYLCIKAPSVTYLIEDLVKHKYAKRSHNTQDRRVIKIVLTPKGQEALKKMYPHRATGFRKVLHQLPKSEQKSFIDTLEKINGIYKIQNNPSK